MNGEVIEGGSLNAEGVRAMQSSPRAQAAQKLYGLATGIRNRAGAFVGYALTGAQLNELLRDPAIRGGELARTFFNQYAMPTFSEDVGRYIMVGVELDTFLDLLAGIQVKAGGDFKREIVTPHSAMPAQEINKKEGRW